LAGSFLCIYFNTPPGARRSAAVKTTITPLSALLAGSLKGFIITGDKSLAASAKGIPPVSQKNLSCVKSQYKNAA